MRLQSFLRPDPVGCADALRPHEPRSARVRQPRYACIRDMTIVVAAASPDGIVLASDSRTTMLAAGYHRVASDHTRKLFTPLPGVGIAAHGTAFIDYQTIDGLMAEFIAQRGQNADQAIDAVGESLATFFADRLTEYLRSSGQTVPAGKRPIGFLLAGYDEDGIGRVRQIRLPVPPGGKAVESLDVSTRDRGILWRGQTSYIRRMVEGVDWDGLEGAGVTFPDEVRHDLDRQQSVIMRPITMQDALDAAIFIVRTTIEMERLTDGTYANPRHIPACGGAVQALAVTRSSTEWILKPALVPSEPGRAEAG